MRLLGFLLDSVTLKILWFTAFLVSPPLSTNGSYGESFLISLLYFILMEGLLSRTLGMIITGTIITNANDGNKIGIALAISRTIGRIACMVTIGIGYLMMLTNTNKQGLHDKMAQTFVVYK